ncbi:MAG: carbohydrate ABC transporter permease [Chloroflexi bacterium]|nr:carbohydrate ABC transporter permease [Chloroflexota bacterium]
MFRWFRWPRLVYHLVAIFWALVMLLPLYWAIAASLGVSNAPPAVGVQWWPPAPQWQNYATIFDLIPLRRFLWNSAVVIFWAVPLTVLTSSWAGLAMIQLPFRYQQWLLRASIAWLIIPNTAVWIYRFQIYQWLGIIGRPAALFAPAFAATSPLYVLLYYWSLQRLPYELFESARLDTNHQRHLWWFLAMPLVKPTTIVVALLSFLLYWGDFTSPILYLSNTNGFTAPIGLQFLQQMDSTNWPILMAAAVVILAPSLLLFLLLQRYFLHDSALAQLFHKE